MPNRVPLICLTLVALLLLTVPSGHALSSTPALYLPIVQQGSADSPVEQFERRLLELMNEHRAAAGCPPLTSDSRLAGSARGHSEDMAQNDFFSHTGSDGSSFGDRIRRAGYSFSRAAENIAAGYPTPQSVVEGWMASESHRRNILDCQMRESGVGYAYLANDTGSQTFHHYWTQVFAAPPGAR